MNNSIYKSYPVDNSIFAIHFQNHNGEFFYDANSAGFTAELLDGAMTGRDEHNSIYIYGPSACGKTHLLCGFASDYGVLHPGANIKIVSANMLIGEMLEALHAGKSVSFEKKYCNINLLILDDIAELAGKNATQTAVASIAQKVYQRGGLVIYISTLAPDSVPLLTTSAEDGTASCIATEMHYTGKACNRCFAEYYSKSLGLTLSNADIESLIGKLPLITHIRAVLNTYRLLGATYPLEEILSVHTTSLKALRTEGIEIA